MGCNPVVLEFLCFLFRRSLVFSFQKNEKRSATQSALPAVGRMGGHKGAPKKVHLSAELASNEAAGVEHVNTIRRR